MQRTICEDCRDRENKNHLRDRFQLISSNFYGRDEGHFPGAPRAVLPERGHGAGAAGSVPGPANPDLSPIQLTPPFLGCGGHDRNNAEGGLETMHRISEDSL